MNRYLWKQSLWILKCEVDVRKKCHVEVDIGSRHHRPSLREHRPKMRIHALDVDVDMELGNNSGLYGGLSN